MPHQQVRDCNIYYEDIGIGPVVLFLHSGYSRGIVAFGGQIQPFFHQYRCLLPDFRGHGRTRSASNTWNTPIIAEDMAVFLDALGVQSAHLIGYSLGGGVALHLAARRPKLARSIITIGSAGIAVPDGADAFEPEALLRNGDTATIERMRNMHAEANGGDWQRFMRLSAQDWREYPRLDDQDWQKLAMPLLFIGGESDPFASRERLLAMQARCPHAEIWSVPGGNHRPHMPMEQPREVNARMLAFLAKADA